MIRPLVLVVTPCFNVVKTIDDTIFSVISQSGDFDLHYHVQDGGSNDGTLDLLERWEKCIRSGVLPKCANTVSFSYASSPDNGMYDALNRGFNLHSHADVMSWINADDRLQPGAIQTAVTIFSIAQDVQWIGGRHSYCEESGMPVATLDVKSYSQDLLNLGFYEGRKLFFMQQEGVFWKRELWDKIGSRFNEHLKLAGDFDLWRRFAEHADYVSIDAVLASFCIRPGQATSSLDTYYTEVDESVKWFKDRRDSIWHVLSNNGKLKRKLKLSGRIARYDGTIRQWVLKNQTANIPFMSHKTLTHRAKSIVKRAINYLFPSTKR